MVAGAFFLRSSELANTLMNLTDLLQNRLEGRKCRRCNRRLTDPNSIEEGIGPICKTHQPHEIVIGWAELRMPKSMYGQKSAKQIAEVGFEYFGTWDIVEIMKVQQSNGDWYAFARSTDDNLKIVGMSQYGPVADLMEEVLPDGTQVKYECVHTDSEWVVENEAYHGPTMDLQTKHLYDDC